MGSMWIYVIATSGKSAICQGVFSKLPLACSSKRLSYISCYSCSVTVYDLMNG